MLKAVEEAFTIIHIRISSVKVLGICARHFITGGLIVFVILNTIWVYTAVRELDLWAFIECSVLIILTLYFCLAWIVSWPKAGKLLNKAVEYEEQHKKK